MAGPDRASEEGLIARYFAPLAGPGADGLRDDAATLTPTPGHDLVVTADAVVAGIHYFSDDPPDSIARKALGVNLSDIAAKGAVPRGFLLTLALPDDWTEAWLAGFSEGLGAAAAEAGCPLLGGDTVRSGGPALIGVTAFGEVPSGGIVRRGTAQVGDRICVSGTIGDAALGLRLRLEPEAAWATSLDPAQQALLADRYLHPRPRLALAAAIRRHASAAMDVSDGLAGDLAKMLGAGRTARIGAVPLSEAAARARDAEPGLIEPILTGGDDYEILCTVAPETLDALLAEAAQAGIPLTAIGTVTSGDGPPGFEMGDGTARVFAAGAFSHF
ncbi:thiamine-monophosphate kinase [Methylobacterium brachiatum]|uniref:Thiamine-monophosphate kinase n=1 Tax=Methylobacterium brachiatum TaxID=269660 RepID=A0AAJ1TSP7_9HYPH|nr:thiamine-phosphate kinase [Methylobacterium brachiatum]MCB4805189.1 thiamine-phosphate kinase [Methylobacterium brachiatum]MDF2599895.1 thiamine-monophosphate kinase [Methylobacterium brachiatum]MDQ0546236.1 thiamine-monophosphate kinase [Methylobacterium brachiatum]